MKTKLFTQNSCFALLMSLMLALGVQGIAEAISNFNPSPGIATNTVGTATTDLGSLSIEGTITVDISGQTPDIPNVRESITVSVSGSGVGTGATSTNFENPAGNRATSYSWRETDNNGTDHANAGSFDTNEPLGTVTITVRQAGEITVTVSHTETYQDANNVNRSRTARDVSTFYVVRQAFKVGLNDTVRLLGVTNGVGAGYGATDDFQIYGGDNNNNQVTYAVAGADGSTHGTLYVKKGTRTLSSAQALTTSSRAAVWLQMADASQTVTATVVTPNNETEGVYILRIPKLAVTTATLNTADRTHTAAADPAATDVPTETIRLMGDPERVISADAIKVQVMQSALSGNTVVYNRSVPNVLVKFDVVDKTVTGGYLIPPASGYTIVDRNNNPLTNSPGSARTLHVRADGTNNIAAVGFQFGTTEGTSEITVSVVGTRVNTSKTVDVVIGDETGEQLSISSNTKDSGNSNVFHLVASVVDKDGDPVWGKQVTFRTRFGNLESTPTGDSNITDPSGGTTPLTDYGGGTNAASTEALEGLLVTDRTTRSGLAYVIYHLGTNTGRQEVYASIDDGTKKRQEVTFVVNGPAGSGGGGSGALPSTPTARLTLTPSGSGPSRTVTVNALQADGTPITVPLQVRVSGTPLLAVPQAVTTGTPVPITVPSTPGSYRLTAIDPSGVFATATLDIPVTTPGTLEIGEIGARTANGGQTIEITVRDSSNALVSGSVVVTLRGVVNRTVTITGGTGRIPITLPTTGGPHTVTLSADGYTDKPFEFSATGQQPGPGQQPPPTGPAGSAASLEIDGQRLRSGVVNEPLDALRVRVTDVIGRGVSGDRVTFRVLSPARGTFAGARGRGNAVLVETDSNGYASATFTPTSGGDVVVRASASGVNPVSFILDINGVANGETDTETETRDTGAPPSREISPVVHVGAANRPPMLWVDGGKIYALVGADVQEFGSGVEGAMNVAIGGGKVYWTERTGQSAGTINRANLDGTGVTELASILAVPMGIAVDTAGSKLYWTNSRGRIQSANLDGSKIQNVLQNLPSPMDIALSGGNAYWTQGGNVRVVNLSGTKRIRNISTGADAAMSLAISGGKVYWTERTGQSAGTINRANLDGSAVTQLASIKAVPMGIAVDGSRSKIFWTNSRGRVQSANLDGSKIQNVVDGLGMPGDMVLSNSVAAPTAAKPTTPTQTTQTTDTSKYDVNGDGTVDNTDASLVSTAMNTTNAKYDVNDDGVVNFLDLLLVFDNRDDGAASAPTIVGMQMTAAQVDILQEQIDLLIATGDRSPAAMRTLIYLQQLIATARPEKTQLLANYPNPFNPETWIPYELATDTNVRITIYNTQGVVIRTLELGHQSAGYYTGRDQAAYWDGRNAFGEQVASGIYFYQFETDEMSAMRKMVILK